MKTAAKLAPVTPDIIGRISELLKLYNSRICQVILGSQPKKSASDIALAAQSLGLIMSAIGYVKKGFATLLSTKQLPLLNDFDRIVRVSLPN